MELVPFSESWAGSQAKFDVHALYRRPSVHGGFTVTSPLPLRRASDWKRKGLEYITLATLEDVRKVASELVGVNMTALRDSYDHMGRFRMDVYLAEQQAKDENFVADLKIKVEKFGVEAVTEMMRMTNPHFVMPDGLVAKKVGKKDAVN